MGRTDSSRTDTRELKTISITDPGVNLAVSTEILDTYSGVIITTTTTGNAQTLQAPTNTDAIKRFSVINNDTSTNVISINGTDLGIGEVTYFIWDGTAWVNAGGGGISGIAWGDITGTLSSQIDLQNELNAKASLVGVETLTNKTLTSPKVNVTSDATGDVYYRNAGGLFTRLPVGTVGQVLTLAGGIPSWADAGGSGGITQIFSAYQSSAYSLTSTLTTLIFQSETTNIDGNYNNVNGIWTAPSTGIYQFNVGIGMGTLTAGDDMRSRILVAGATVGAENLITATGGFTEYIFFNKQLSLSSGDTLAIQVANITAARGVTKANDFRTYFEGYKIN